MGCFGCTSDSSIKKAKRDNKNNKNRNHCRGHDQTQNVKGVFFFLFFNDLIVIFVKKIKEDVFYFCGFFDRVVFVFL